MSVAYVSGNCQGQKIQHLADVGAFVGDKSTGSRRRTGTKHLIPIFPSSII